MYRNRETRWTDNDDIYDRVNVLFSVCLSESRVSNQIYLCHHHFHFVSECAASLGADMLIVETLTCPLSALMMREIQRHHPKILEVFMINHVVLVRETGP